MVSEVLTPTLFQEAITKAVAVHAQSRGSIGIELTLALALALQQPKIDHKIRLGYRSDPEESHVPDDAIARRAAGLRDIVGRERARGPITLGGAYRKPRRPNPIHLEKHQGFRRDI